VNVQPRIRNLELREYDSPEGYINALRQLTKQGYNYFLPVKKSRRKSTMLIGKVTQPRSRVTLH
jgi:hypothetical protein